MLQLSKPSILHDCLWVWLFLSRGNCGTQQHLYLNWSMSYWYTSVHYPVTTLIQLCTTSTENCPEGYEYKECGSPCTKTCYNYDEVIICAAVCESGCFCPEGTVEHNETCISTDECPQVCTGGKEWQECGTACPLTCDNYDNPPFACTLQCVQGCFCPSGKVDLNGVCVEPHMCSSK